MVFMYRADLFAKYGLQVPTTWAQYGTLAAKVRRVDPHAYLGGYPGDGATFAGYTQPIGDQWYSTDGNSWTININGAADVQMAQFWQKLVEADQVDTTAFFTPDWNKAMNDGGLLSWTAGVWAPGVVESVAEKTKGDWKIAPMPSWSGEDQVGVDGGSASMVTKTSKHPKQAVQYLSWLNASEAGPKILAQQGGQFPASLQGQSTLTSLPVPALVSDQKDYWTVAQQIAKTTAPVTWGPNVQIAYDTYSDAIKTAAAKKTSFAAVLNQTQSAVVADLKKNGFTVK
jgi:multiple sugar transport system substrate-binding protein